MGLCMAVTSIGKLRFGPFRSNSKLVFDFLTLELTTAILYQFFIIRFFKELIYLASSAISLVFLRDNPSEFIVIRLKQEYTGPGQSDVNFTARVFNAFSKYPNYFLLNGNHIPTISQARGKVVVMTGFSDNRTIYFDGSNPILTIQDDYDQYWRTPGCCSKIASMKAQVVTADNSTNLWSISHATGTGEISDGQVPPHPGCSPRDVAYKTNKDVFNWLAVPSHHNWGIFIFDFPSPGLISRVIALN